MTTAKTSALLALTLAGCSEPAQCVETSRAPVTDPAAALSIGGTYADALATVVGERSGTISWLDSDAYVSGFPAPSEASITVTIEEPTETWDVQLAREGGGRNERLACPSALEVELQVELQTADGMLDATVTAPTTFHTPNAVTISVDITDEDLGMLDWSPVDPDASLLLVLSYGAATGPEGSLRLRSGSSDDAEGVGTSVALATWTLE